MDDVCSFTDICGFRTDQDPLTISTCPWCFRVTATVVPTGNINATDTHWLTKYEWCGKCDGENNNSNCCTNVGSSETSSSTMSDETEARVASVVPEILPKVTVSSKTLPKKELNPPRHHFKCSQCAFEVDRQSALIRHIRTHTGERPFRCTFKGCDKRFSEKGNLRRHMRVHTKEKPYRCTIDGCTSKYSRRDHLKNHIRAKHHRK